MSLVVWGAIAAASAFGAGLCLVRAHAQWSQRRNQRKAVCQGLADGGSADLVAGGTLLDRVIVRMETVAHRQRAGRERVSARIVAVCARGFPSLERTSGVRGRISAEAFAKTRIDLALACGLAGLAFGLVLSAELGMVLLLAGLAAGWMMPARALRYRIAQRSARLEEHLPEMLDVVALGMRSGLSFDASLRLYADSFKTMLARELALAQCEWSSGLERRDEALRELAASYDSPVFERLVETMVRSMRFGSSMVSSLEEDAREARSIYKARKEERIAKAPVKMMIPTGTLILPAMLIMVLGPVLLELMGGVA